MPRNSHLSPILSYLIGAACIVLIIAGLKLAAPIVNLILISFLLAFSISPLQNWLIKKRFPKGLAIVVTIALILIGGSGLISFLAVSVAGLIGKLPAYEASLTSLWNALNSFFINQGINISGLLSLKEFEPKQVIEFAGNLLGIILQGLSNSFFVVLVMVFVLIELAGWQFLNIRDDKSNTGFQKQVYQVVTDVGKYISITGWNGFLNALVNYLFLLILGVDFALTWAVLSFLFNFIPNIGFIMALIPPATIALLEFGWVRAVLVVAGYVLFNFIAENVFKPRTMKAGLDISPLMTILSIIVWSWVLGAAGTILAVPLTISLQKLIKQQVE
jgi:AI-2 transport protein TqsA